MKNILVVTDQFMRGGMETHIINQAEYLRSRGFQVHLATQRILEKPGKNVFTGIDASLQFSDLSTLAQIRLSVNKLEEAVNKWNIDLIHAHPFYAPLVAAIAAKRTQKPYILTLHGPTSLDIEATAARLAFRQAVVPEASEVICVSAEVQRHLRSISSRVGNILPNAVSVSSSKYLAGSNPSTWLFASRFDQDKIIGALAFIDFANSIGASCVMAGDGSERETLENYVKVTNAADRIIFAGWCPDVSLTMNEYFCVTGMGRVALEALASDVPVLLAGYDGLKGFVDAEMFHKAKFANFSGRGLKSLNFEQLTEQTHRVLSNPAPYRGRQWISGYADSEAVWTTYEQILARAECKDFFAVNAFHDAIFEYTETDIIAWEDKKFNQFLFDEFCRQESRISRPMPSTDGSIDM